MQAASLGTLAELLGECSLEHLLPPLSSAGLTLRGLDEALAGGRPPLLEALKAAGAARLPERQALVNCLSKAKRAGRLVPMADEGAATTTSTAAVVAPVDVSEPEVTPAAASASAAPRKLRVLCLHAFRTNGSILQAQLAMSGLGDLLRDDLDLVFGDAPHACTPEDEAKQYDIVKKIFPKATMGAYREWFNATSVTKGGEREAEYVEYAHHRDSIQHVASTLAAASPPFDGLMGFSQGGSLAVWIAALRQKGVLSPECPPLKFIWVMSARTPRDVSCKGLFDAPLATPCFLSFNEDDQEVRPQETRKLLAHLSAAVVAVRPKGGHALMAVKRAPEDGQRLLAFLRERRDAQS